MNIVFFRRTKPKKFEYKPRYYDPEKEALEERRREMGLAEGMTHEERLRAEMRSRWGSKNKQKEDPYNRTIRTIIYLFILALFVYFIFFTDFIHNLLSFFTTR